MLKYCADKDIVYDADAVRQPKEGKEFKTCEETLTAKGMSLESAKELCGNLNKDKVGGGPPRDLTLTGPSTVHSKPNKMDSLMHYDAETRAVQVKTGSKHINCVKKLMGKGYSRVGAGKKCRKLIAPTAKRDSLMLYDAESDSVITDKG